MRSGILYALLQASVDGHTYLPEAELTRRASDLLGVDGALIEKHYMDLAIERKLVLKEKDGQMQIYAALIIIWKTTAPFC